MSEDGIDFQPLNQPQGSGDGIDFQPGTPPSKIESAIHGFVNNVPLGPQIAAGVDTLAGKAGLQVPGLAENKPTYSENISDLNQKMAEGKKENPISYDAGAVTGTIAPLAAPVVGEAMKAAPVATSAAMGAGNAINNTDLLKEPKKAAEEAATGAALGGGTAALLGSIFPEAANFEKRADRVRAQGLNLSPKLLGNLSPEELEQYGNFAKVHDLVSNHTEQALKNAEAAHEIYGKQISAIGGEALPLKNPEPHIEALLKKAESIQNLEEPSAKADANYYLRGAMDIEQNGKTFGDLQKLKSYYGDKAFGPDHTVKNEAAASVWGEIKNAMKSIVSDSPEQYQQTMKNYQMANDAANGLTRKLGAERQGYVRNGIGMIGRIVGKMPGQSNPAINLPTAAAIGLAGHPMMGFMAATPSLTNPAVRAAGYEAMPEIFDFVKRASGQAASKVSPEMAEFVRRKLRGE